MQARQKQPGFTIVELLIVIVVIAILAGISLVAFTGVQQRARDSQRLSDVKQITKAMQLWSTDTSKSFEEMNVGFVNASATGWFTSAYNGGASIKSVLVQSGYLNEVVKDPTGGRDYMLTRCTSATDNRRVVMARLENPPSQTVAQQLQSSGCNDIYINAFVNASYYMNYAVVVGG